MADKHTPGPWAQMGDEIYGADGTRIAEAVTMRDALLLTAAPELLEALCEITADYADRFDLHSPSTNPGIKSSIKLARAAIAKATGEEVAHG